MGISPSADVALLKAALGLEVGTKVVRTMTEDGHSDATHYRISDIKNGSVSLMELGAGLPDLKYVPISELAREYDLLPAEAAEAIVLKSADLLKTRDCFCERTSYSKSFTNFVLYTHFQMHEPNVKVSLKVADGRKRQ